MRASLRPLMFCCLLFLTACARETTVSTSQPETTPTPEVAVSESPVAVATEPDAGTDTGEVPCESTSRKSFEGRPIITVTAPCPGDSLSSPATIAGEANVFEATVSMRVLDENGNEIATSFTTAECGTGCWGAFEGEIQFDVPHEQTGTVEVFESSAEDGRDLHKVSIEVTLLP